MKSLIVGLFLVLIVGLFLVMFLVACHEEPVSCSSTENPNIPVDILFTKDGYTVHRFIDGGHAVYYVTPQGSTSQDVNCGKGCTRLDITDTIFKAQ